MSPGTPVASPGLRRAAQRHLRVAALSGGIVLVVLVPVLRLWHADLHRPFYDTSDALVHQLAIDSTLDHGWYLHDPDLAAPAGGDLAQFPYAETLPLLMVRGLALLQVDAPAVALNLLYLASFPLVAMVSALAFRRLGASSTTAVGASVLYAFLPYHFVRNEAHLFLALYLAAPILGWLLVDTLRGEPVLRWHSGWRATVLAPGNLGTIVLALLIGLSSAYYAAFALLLLTIAGALRALTERRWRALVAPLVVAAVAVLATAPQLMPGAIDRARGEPQFEPNRTAGQSELLALRLVDLVLPVTVHAVDPLGAVSRSVRDESFISDLPEVENSAALGVVGTVGFLLLVVAGTRSILGGRRREDPDDDGVIAAASVASALVFATATVGGVSALVAYGVGGDIRAWSRLSVLLAFFCLLAAARAMDRQRPRLSRWRAAFPALVAGIVCLGVLDQAPVAFVPPYETSAISSRASEVFTTEVASALPEGARVLQLPFVSFPEATARHRLPTYEQLRPTLYTDSLRWSTAAVDGTAEDWSRPLLDAPAERQLLAGAAVGFDAVWLDLRGTEDPEATQATFEALLGPADHASTDWPILVWDLRPHAEELRARADDVAATDAALRDAIDAAGG